MKAPKRLLFFCVLHLICLQLSAQKGEMQTDSSSYFGIKIYNNGPKINSQYCDYELAGKRIRTSPDSITSYTTAGTKYISRSLILGKDSVNKFLEIVNEGTYNLYLYRDDSTKQFYLERDSTLFTPLGENQNDLKSFKEELEKYNISPQNPEALKYVKYNRYSLKTFFQAINNESYLAFPHFQYGFTYTFSLINYLSPSYNNEFLLYDCQRTAFFSNSLGAFIFLPILSSNTTLRSEVQLTKQKSKEQYFNQDNDIDLITNTLWLDYQQLLRYTLPKRKVKPYFEGGFALRFLVDDKTKLHSSTYDDNRVYINAPYTPNIYSKLMLGYTAGAGFSYPISDYELSLGITITQMFPHTDKHTYGHHSIGLKTHFTF